MLPAIRIWNRRLWSVLLLGLSISLVGCGTGSSAAQTGQVSTSTSTSTTTSTSTKASPSATTGGAKAPTATAKPKPAATATAKPKPTATATPKPHPSVHVVTSQQYMNNPGYVYATCPSGEVALSGGWTHAATDPGRIIISARNGTAGWKIFIDDASTTPLVNAYVVCLKNAKGATIAERGSGAHLTAPGTIGTLYASCAAGEVVVGGGYYADDGTLTLYNFTANGSSWGGYVYNHNAAWQNIRFYAECLKYTGAHSSFTAPASTHSNGAVATCPSGSYASGGGFASNQNSYAYHLAPSGGGWQIYVAPAAGLNVYAECLSFS